MEWEEEDYLHTTVKGLRLQGVSSVCKRSVEPCYSEVATAMEALFVLGQTYETTYEADYDTPRPCR
jgi:hypothetical protein